MGRQAVGVSLPFGRNVTIAPLIRRRHSFRRLIAEHRQLLLVSRVTGGGAGTNPAYKDVRMTRNLNAVVTSFAAAAAIALSLAAHAAPPAATPAGAADSTSVITESGFTKPYERAEMTLQTYGIILEIPVKRGNAVKKGDVLLKQDDRADVKALEALQL